MMYEAYEICNQLLGTEYKLQSILRSKSVSQITGAIRQNFTPSTVNTNSEIIETHGSMITPIAGLVDIWLRESGSLLERSSLRETQQHVKQTPDRLLFIFQTWDRRWATRLLLLDLAR